MMNQLINDPTNYPYSAEQTQMWALLESTMMNAGVAIYDLTDDIYYGPPGFYATTAGGIFEGQYGLNNDQVVATTLYGLAAANVIECFANPTSANALLSTEAPINAANPTIYYVNFLNSLGGQELMGFSLDPGQFAPTINIQSMASAMYLAYTGAINNLNINTLVNSFIGTNSGLSPSQEATVGNLLNMFLEMINVIGNNNIYPLLQLSSIYDKLVNDPVDLSHGTLYGVNLLYQGSSTQRVWGGWCSVYASTRMVSLEGALQMHIINKLLVDHKRLSRTLRPLFNEDNTFLGEADYDTFADCSLDVYNLQAAQQQLAYAQACATYASYDTDVEECGGIFNAQPGHQYIMYYDSNNFVNSYTDLITSVSADSYLLTSTGSIVSGSWTNK